MTAEDWLAHFDNCTKCTPWTPCADGARILEQATTAIAARVGPLLVDISQPKGDA